MYCPKCGKWIDYQADVCNECKAAGNYQPNYEPHPNYQQQAPYGFYQQPQAFNAPVSTEPDPTNRSYGIGKAVVSLVFGIISIFCSMYAWACSLVLYYGTGGAALVLFLISLPFTIIGLIFGISSIKCFKRRKATCAKNIPTLVLGIVGLAESAYGAFFLLLSLFMLLLAI